MPSAFSADIISTAAAASEICDAVPAVWKPFSSRATVLSPARASMVVSRRPSSRVMRVVSPVGLPSSPSTGASTGMIWVPKRSSSHATAARRCDSTPNWSSSSRVMPHFSAMRSAASNWVVYSCWAK